MRLIDLTNKRFGRLMAVSLSLERTKTGQARWECICDCGNNVTVVSASLIRGNTTSCGCYKNEIHRKRLTRHGHAGSRNKKPKASLEYITWCSMIARCKNESNRDYRNYGGRGIKVCNRWLSFPNFLQDMGNRPSAMHTLERINNDKNYSPQNCEWATRKKQNNNRRNNRVIECFGKQMNLSQWSQETGIPTQTIKSRIDQLGWPTEKALTIRMEK